MKRHPLRLTAMLILSIVSVLSFGCGSQPPTPNQTANSNTANATGNVEKSAPVAKRAEDECNITNIGERRKKVHEKIEEKIKDKNSEKGLGKQYAEKAFTVKTEVYQMHLVVYVAGMVHGSDELKELANILNDFDKKDGGCVSRVAFVSWKSLKDGSYRRDAGFEWTYCPFDLRPCSDGTCDPGCKRKKPFDRPSVADDPPEAFLDESPANSSQNSANAKPSNTSP